MNVVFDVLSKIPFSQIVINKYDSNVKNYVVSDFDCDQTDLEKDGEYKMWFTYDHYVKKDNIRKFKVVIGYKIISKEIRKSDSDYYNDFNCYILDNQCECGIYGGKYKKDGNCIYSSFYITSLCIEDMEKSASFVDQEAGALLSIIQNDPFNPTSIDVFSDFFCLNIFGCYPSEKDLDVAAEKALLEK